MKKILVIVSICFFSQFSVSQSIDGAWQLKKDTISTTWIIADGYYMKATYSVPGNRFISASGGIIKAYTGSIEIEVEFNSANKEDVGNNHLYDFSIAGNSLTTKHHEDIQLWKRIDDGKPGRLFGAWLFSGRRQNPNDSISPYTPGVRKTMKIMSGTRFQWAAFNTETKEFLGTGGGTYITLNGRYTENIDVFSKDNSRVGASLSFDMEIKEPHWMHSGKSSKGDPIYERWSLRSSFNGQ
jgi:hypothetical protein